MNQNRGKLITYPLYSRIAIAKREITATIFTVIRLNERQTSIMIFAKGWAEKEKTPIPQRAIIDFMQTQGVKNNTAYNAISGLVSKGYIRRAYGEGNKNRTFYVMIRTL